MKRSSIRALEALLFRLLADQRGAMAVEYLMLVTFVGVTTALALAGLLPGMLAQYAQQRATLSLPYP
ncbi:MAG TPA: hypothetical protein VK524_28415 [Polyangiaceae bacterium]|jgi:Flp pilus assembly pilin Flp|nr:hypothetical protein [Polyangiaceae bacterium]